MRGTKNTADEVKYVNFMFGKMVRRVTEGVPGAMPRELTKGVNEGKIVYELQFDEICGGIVKIDRKETDFGWKLIIQLDCGTEGEDIYQLNLDFDSFVAIRLMNQLLNHNLTKDVSLKAYSIPREDDKSKNNYYLVAYDGEVCKDNKIAPQFEREQLPEPTVAKIKGKEVKDYFPVADFVFTKLSMPVASAARTKPAEVESNDDLPF